MADILMAADAPASQAINLSLFTKDQGGVTVTYTTFDTNKPKTFGNTLYVWESDTPIVPWQNVGSFVGSTTIGKDTYIDTQRIDFPYEVGKGYVIGYAVAPDPNATCATLFIPANNAPTSSPSLNVTFGGLAPGAVSLHYNALQQYNPSANGNWVGIWNGPRALYDGAPLKTADVPYPNSSGSVGMQVQLLVGATYTMGYFMTPLPAGKTSLAAQVTFNTAG